MSRSSPIGFVVGVIAELAAVVFIVSLVPKIDLRTIPGDGRAVSAEYAGFSQPAAPVSQPPLIQATPLPPAAILPSFQTTPQETSYYQRRTAASAFPPPAAEAALSRQPPPLIAVDPARPAYVEQRLDRASQGLVNNVGTYLSRAADDLRRPAQQPTAVPQPATAAPDLTFPTQPQSSPPSISRPRLQLGSVQNQPRPWMRY